MSTALPAPPEHPRSLIYFGSPEAAVPSLVTLAESGFEIPLVVSMPDRRRTRRAAPSPTPVKKMALDLGIPVTDQISDALSVKADCGVVVAYGQLISSEFLMKLPMVNVHFSLLPRWRGAAPVERAILAGDQRTGVCIMGLEPELDTGPIYRKREVLIDEQVTASELTEQLAVLGAGELLSALQDGLRDPKPQEGNATIAKKLFRSDLKLDWTLSAAELSRLIRVGGAWTTINSSSLKVHQVKVIEGESEAGKLTKDVVGTGRDLLQLLVVQPEGKSRLDAVDWVNGARLGDETYLGK